MAIAAPKKDKTNMHPVRSSNVFLKYAITGTAIVSAKKTQNNADWFSVFEKNFFMFFVFLGLFLFVLMPV